MKTIEVREMAKNECEKIGYEFIAMRDVKGEGNDYLKYVIGYNENKEEFGVWILNSDLGGLHNGYYCNHWYKSKEEAYKLALENYNNR